MECEESLAYLLKLKMKRDKAKSLHSQGNVRDAEMEIAEAQQMMSDEVAKKIFRRKERSALKDELQDLREESQLPFGNLKTSDIIEKKYEEISAFCSRKGSHDKETDSNSN